MEKIIKLTVKFILKNFKIILPTNNEAVPSIPRLPQIEG